MEDGDGPIASASGGSGGSGGGGSGMDIRDMKDTSNLTAAQKMSLKMSESKRGRSRTPKRAVQVGGAESGKEAEQAAAAGKTVNPEKAASRMRSKTPLRTDEQWSYRNVAQKQSAEQQAFLAQRKMNRNARIGEADRHQAASKPKHLFTGKAGIGTRDRR